MFPRKYFAAGLVAALLVMAISAASLYASAARAEQGMQGAIHWKIMMTGDQERLTPVVTDADGFLQLTFFPKKQELKFNLIVCNIEDVRGAHIHVGGPEVAGPIIFFLFPGDVGFVPADEALTAVPGCRQLAQGTLTADDLILAGGITSFDDFVMALLEGGTYANVHTIEHGGGEIRGQIVGPKGA